jgi:arylsulfatase
MELPVVGEDSIYTCYPGTQLVPASAGVNIHNRPHCITADAEIPEEGGEGLIFAHGGSDGGYSLYVQDGVLHDVHHDVAKESFHVESMEPVPAGQQTLRFEFRVTGPPETQASKAAPGWAQLYFDGRLVGKREFPYTTPQIFSVAGGALEVGHDGGSPVTAAYAPTFGITSTIDSVRVGVSGELIRDSKDEIRVILARQKERGVPVAP